MRVAGARTAKMENIWHSGVYVGKTAATARATIRPGNIRLTRTRDYGDFASIVFSYTQGLFGTDTRMLPRELPNIKSVSWNRSTDQDVAQCTIEIYNTLEDPISGEIQGGYFTWNHGDNPFTQTVVQTTVPQVGGASAFQQQAFQVTNYSRQLFQKIDGTAKVRQIRLVVPTGQAGTYTVRMQNSNQQSGPVQVYRTSPPMNVATTLHLAEGINLVTLPSDVELADQRWYILSLEKPGTFKVTISANHSAVAEGVAFLPPKTQTIQQTEHMLFGLYGPPVQTVTGKHNDWYGWLVPDNIIQTFEGYGVDWTRPPEADENLLITGNWLIDKVENDGSIITLTCRDFGRLLLDQILFPPVVPRKSAIAGIQYPVYFYSKKPQPFPASEQYTRVRTTFRSSSNGPWVGNDGAVLGHYPHQAFDGNSASYWLSVGNQHSNDGYSFEWIEGNVGNSRLAAVEFRTWGSHYRGWVSVYANGRWVNRGTIPYDPNNPVSAPNGSNIPYVASFNGGNDGALQRVTFAPIPGATRIRITLSNLQDSGHGPWRLRAGMREMVALAGKDVAAGTNWIPGNYDDYTDIVKLLLAWGGFHWPVGLPIVATSDGKPHWVGANPPNDTFLKEGRIWGDLEKTGTWGPATLTIDNFDKKPIMDGINYVRDIVGFYFGIDETGGAIWRSPNWFERGNWLGGIVDSQGNGVRTQKMLRILDTQTLQSIKSTLDGQDARERLYVATPDGRFVGGARGYNLNPIGLRRVAGWIDMHFISNAECQQMAELIAIQSMVNYRKLDITIAGIPTLQVDDQIEVVDHATGEGYVHYVRGISSKLDHSTGEYTYTITTNWLGTRPGEEWMLTETKLADGTKYRQMSQNLQELLDFSDRGRKDGVYDQMGAVTLWVSGDYSNPGSTP